MKIMLLLVLVVFVNIVLIMLRMLKSLNFLISLIGVGCVSKLLIYKNKSIINVVLLVFCLMREIIYVFKVENMVSYMVWFF